MAGNRIDLAFEEKGSRLLNVYYTAGYPELDDTLRIAKDLEQAGADLIELGMPFSDPIADGPTIQKSSEKALMNGMSLEVLFDQLKDLRPTVSIPVILMGYLNPIIQYGIERFCHKCAEVGVDGVILPDLPIREYQEVYQKTFSKNGIHNIFLVTPQTTDERIRIIDSISNGFIYIVSSSSITGKQGDIETSQIEYFKRINKMGLKTPTMIGFGISNKESFDKACEFAHGAIIGSAFIRLLEKDSSTISIRSFIEAIKS
jgi:tryptophan synthase alpha chain